VTSVRVPAGAERWVQRGFILSFLNGFGSISFNGLRSGYPGAARGCGERGTPGAAVRFAAVPRAGSPRLPRASVGSMLSHFSQVCGPVFGAGGGCRSGSAGGAWRAKGHYWDGFSRWKPPRSPNPWDCGSVRGCKGVGIGGVPGEPHWTRLGSSSWALGCLSAPHGDAGPGYLRNFRSLFQPTRGDVGFAVRRGGGRGPGPDLAAGRARGHLLNVTSSCADTRGSGAWWKNARRPRSYVLLAAGVFFLGEI